MKKGLPALVLFFVFWGIASASANQWYVEYGTHGGERRRLDAGESAEVETAGTWKLKLKLAKHGGTKATCAEHGTELLTNVTRQEATDQTTSVSLTCNEGVVATAVLLPWSGELAGNCQPCTITRPMSFEVSVDGTDYGVFTGLVEGRIGDFDDPIRDDIDHAYKWRGTKGGVLTNGSGATLAVAGGETYGLPGDEACGEPDDGASLEEEGMGEKRRREARARAGLPGDGDDG